jgi:hypothetical protein
MVVAYNGNSMTDNGKKKRRRTAAKAATPGPRIVRAWFDTVINPILRALELENSRLIRSNWSWQYRLRVLEDIRPIRVYISHGMQDNLEHFLNFTPEVKPHVDRHDEEVAQLEKNCSTLHTALISKSSLLALYKELTTPEALQRAFSQSRLKNNPAVDLSARDVLAEFFGGYPTSDHISILAEYIINNTCELPEHYTTAPFWNAYRERLMQVLKEPKVNAEYRKTSAAGAKLRATSNRLRDELQQIRLSLSIEHDVPYVDPQSIQPSEAAWRS